MIRWRRAEKRQFDAQQSVEALGGSVDSCINKFLISGGYYSNIKYKRRNKKKRIEDKREGHVKP